MQGKIRLMMYKTHIAYLNPRLLKKFESTCQVVNFNTWFKTRVYDEVGILIDSKEAVDEVKGLVEDMYYENLGEWLNEQMRKDIKAFEED